MQQKSLLGLTMFMLAALAVLLGLGFWQLSRMQWKQGIIAQIETRTTSAPISLEAAEALVREGRDPSYFRVSVEGRFHHAKEQYLYAVYAGRVGWHVITPLETADGEMVLIDRGFVPDALRAPSSRPDGQIERVTTVTGIVRAPDTQTLFIPDNEPAANRWFWRDLHAMSRQMFQQRLIDVAPFFLEADNTPVPGGWPEGGQTRLEIPNNHLQYAITWFALALCLAVIYAVYIWGWLSGRQK
jgi:surfeit locus 1 family protein